MTAATISERSKNEQKMSDCFVKSGSRILCNSIFSCLTAQYALFNDLSRIYFIIMGNQKFVRCRLNYIKHTRMLGNVYVVYVRSTDSTKISRRCIFNQIHRALSKEYYGFCVRPHRKNSAHKSTKENYIQRIILHVFMLRRMRPTHTKKIWKSD